MNTIRRPVKAVVFDFDYTLADSSTGAVESFRYAFERLGLPQPRDIDIRETIGLSLEAAFRRLVNPDHWGNSEQFAVHYMHRADQVVAANTTLYESVPHVVEALVARDLSLAIVSNKLRYRVHSILEREGITDRFEVVVGAEDVDEQKPDPSGLLLALGEMGRSPAEVLYVGDSVVDGETAQRAGVAFLGVLSGVTPEAAIRAYYPRAVLHDLRELPALVDG